MKVGDLVPHFDVLACDGRFFRYATVWQRLHLVLITLAGADDAAALGELMALDESCRARRGVCVVTCEPVVGVPARSILVADKWGEIVHLATLQRLEDFPSAAQLLEWLDYLEQRCPECEGETR